VTKGVKQCCSMILKLLAQILIKIHAGPSWGMSEKEVLSLVREAHKLSEDIERGLTDD